MAAKAGFGAELDVVIATNRRGAFFDETLASVAAQVAVRCNVVVVDDGSRHPADIRSAVANFANAVVVRQDAAGVSVARNRGLREGAGEFVAFLDDDDVWHPEKSAKQLAAIRDMPAAVACACDGWYIDEAGRRLGGWHPVGEHVSSDYLAGTTPLPRIVTLILRRATCVLEGGFDARLRIAEDHDFINRMLLHGSCAVVPEKLVGYRQHAANTSRTPRTYVEGRSSTITALRWLIARCLAEGRVEEAALLRRQYARRRGEWLLDSARTLNAARRQRSVSGMALESRWMLAHSAWLPQAVPALVRHLRQHQAS